MELTQRLSQHGIVLDAAAAKNDGRNEFQRCFDLLLACLREETNFGNNQEQLDAMSEDLGVLAQLGDVCGVEEEVYWPIYQNEMRKVAFRSKLGR